MLIKMEYWKLRFLGQGGFFHLLLGDAIKSIIKHNNEIDRPACIQSVLQRIYCP